MTLTFYDIETSGTAKGFDQILQFAAVQTDDELEPLEEPLELRSRLMPHVVPAPMALQVTGMRIDQLLDPARPSHYEMVCKIRDALGAWCPSVFVGYNSLRFDEEFLRQAFYQCLHPPYLTNTGGSGRADALLLMRALALLDPEALTVPAGDNGRPTYKLDRIAPANGLVHNAHDALGDVEVMVTLCRRARDRQPALWDRFVAMGHKARVLEFMAEHPVFVSVESAAGVGVANVVVKVAANPAQPNLIYSLDLRCDLAELAGLDDEDLRKRLARSPRPIRRVKANAAPLLFALEEVPARMLRGLAPAEARARGELVRSDPAFAARLLAASVAAERVYEPSPHVEAQLYEGGFWSSGDERLLMEFHQPPWERRIEVLGLMQDRRLRLLAKRIIYMERPDLLLSGEREAIERGLRQRLLADDDLERPWLTVPQALRDVDALLGGDLSASHLGLLQGYRAHLLARLCEVEPV